MSTMSAALFTAFLIVIGIGYWLKYLNLTYLKAHGQEVPPEFHGVVDSALLTKISTYTFENNRFGIVESIIGNIILLLVLFSGALGAYDRWVTALADTFLWGGVLFFLILLYAEMIIDIPFSLYRHFIIENRYEFNTMTLRIWCLDLLKSIVLATVLGSLVVMAALAIIQAYPGSWWIWVWAFFLFFGIFVMYLSPYVIEPLFFKFEAVTVPGLEDKVRILMERAGLKVSRVFQVDASRRSRHSNAYFTGIGRVKRIVLFDTLIEQMSEDEILAILAHEVGHWKKRHVLKRIMLTETMAFCGLFLASRLLEWDGLSSLVGLTDASFYVRVVIVGFISSIAMFPLTPLFSLLSRRDEREADRFAAALTSKPEALASALVKLSRENLANLHPHPVYAKFYYSHPPVVERVRILMNMVGT